MPLEVPVTGITTTEALQMNLQLQLGYRGMTHLAQAGFEPWQIIHELNERRKCEGWDQ